MDTDNFAKIPISVHVSKIPNSPDEMKLGQIGAVAQVA